MRTFLNLKKIICSLTLQKSQFFLKKNPDAPLIRMGIGDVTLPIAPVCVEAMKKVPKKWASKKLSKANEDSGTGYDF